MRALLLDTLGMPVVRRELRFEVQVACPGDGSSGASSVRSLTLVTDSDGRFALRIPQPIPVGCVCTLVVQPGIRKGLDPGLDTVPRFEIEVPAAHDSPTLDLGVVRMTMPGTGRPYQTWTDDELERAVPTALTSSLSEPRHELESLLTEMIHRGGPRFEAFLTAQREVLRAQPTSSSSRERDFFLLTALRRIQQRPDPLLISAIEDGVPRADFPSVRVVHVRLTNVDESGTQLDVVEGCTDWCREWHVEVRTREGEPVPPRVWPFLGSTGCDARRSLAPGEYANGEVQFSRYAAFSEPGVYEARLSYLESAYIAEERHLENRIVSSSPWIRFEILPRTVRCTTAELQRARAAIASVDDSTPVRILNRPCDPARTLTGEDAAGDVAIWRLGWQAMEPLLEALQQASLGPHERAWILAQLFNLTDLHDPRVQRSVLGDYVEASVGASPEDGTWHLSTSPGSGSAPIDEVLQRELALRWKQSARGFVFEHVDAAPPK